jgi:hypothetical protein
MRRGNYNAVQPRAWKGLLQEVTESNGYVKLVEHVYFNNFMIA